MPAPYGGEAKDAGDGSCQSGRWGHTARHVADVPKPGWRLVSRIRRAFLHLQSGRIRKARFFFAKHPLHRSVDEGRFDIRDISVGHGSKIITDASDEALLARIKDLDHREREHLLRGIQAELSQAEINLLLGRRQGLEEFERQLGADRWAEADWQNFFERQTWVFGYGLDYRIMRPFDREMVVGAGGTDNRDRPTVDYLMNFTDYSVLVEIKRPDTPIFHLRRSGRSGTWRFSNEFMDAVSQVLEQKAEWLVQAQTGQNYDKSGDRRLTARTRDPKAILVIGRRRDVEGNGSTRDAEVRRDTFELFRRDTRNLDIVTFDELLDRARFITRD
jgi:hypothetical protein